METTRLSTKGQIILPKDIRDAHSWKPGTEFTVEESGDGILLRPASRFPRTELKDVVGCLRVPKGKPKSLAQMDAGIRKEIKRRRDLGRY